MIRNLITMLLIWVAFILPAFGGPEDLKRLQEEKIGLIREIQDTERNLVSLWVSIDEKRYSEQRRKWRQLKEQLRVCRNAICREKSYQRSLNFRALNSAIQTAVVNHRQRYDEQLALSKAHGRNIHDFVAYRSQERMSQRELGQELYRLFSESSLDMLEDMTQILDSPMARTSEASELLESQERVLYFIDHVFRQRVEFPLLVLRALVDSDRHLIQLLQEDALLRCGMSIRSLAGLRAQMQEHLAVIQNELGEVQSEFRNGAMRFFESRRYQYQSTITDPWSSIDNVLRYIVNHHQILAIQGILWQRGISIQGRPAYLAALRRRSDTLSDISQQVITLLLPGLEEEPALTTIPPFYVERFSSFLSPFRDLLSLNPEDMRLVIVGHEYSYPVVFSANNITRCVLCVSDYHREDSSAYWDWLNREHEQHQGQLPRLQRGPLRIRGILPVLRHLYEHVPSTLSVRPIPNQGEAGHLFSFLGEAICLDA